MHKPECLALDIDNANVIATHLNDHFRYKFQQWVHKYRQMVSESSMSVHFVLMITLRPCKVPCILMPAPQEESLHGHTVCHG